MFLLCLFESSTSPFLGGFGALSTARGSLDVLEGGKIPHLARGSECGGILTLVDGPLHARAHGSCWAVFAFFWRAGQATRR